MSLHYCVKENLTDSAQKLFRYGNRNRDNSLFMEIESSKNAILWK